MATRSFAYHTQDIAPFDPAQKELIIQWLPSHLLVVLKPRLELTIDAAEVFQGDFEQSDALETSIALSSLLSYKNLPVRLIVGNQRFIPIPTPLFETQQAQNQLEALCGRMPHQVNLVNDHTQTQLMLFWQLPQSIQQQFSEHFSWVTYQHLGSYLLAPATSNQPQARLLFCDQFVLVSLWNLQQLLFLGSISISVPDDLGYHLLNLCKSYELDSDTVSFSWSGMLEMDSTLFKTLFQFLPSLTTWSPAELNQESAHYFSHLF